MIHICDIIDWYVTRLLQVIHTRHETWYLRHDLQPTIRDMILSTWPTTYHTRHDTCDMTYNLPYATLDFHTCDLSHLQRHSWKPRCKVVWHDSFICVTWLIYTCDMTHLYVWHDSFICMAWLMHIFDVTPSYSWHDSFMCDMTHSYVWRDSRMHRCDVTDQDVWHDSFVCVVLRNHMCHMSHSQQHSRKLRCRVGKMQRCSNSVTRTRRQF